MSYRANPTDSQRCIRCEADPVAIIAGGLAVGRLGRR